VLDDRRVAASPSRPKIPAPADLRLLRRKADRLKERRRETRRPRTSAGLSNRPADRTALDPRAREFESTTSIAVALRIEKVERIPMQISRDPELDAGADLARRDRNGGAVADGVQSFAVQVSPDVETLLLRVSGEIDLANSGELASALCPASMTSIRRVIVDLSDVTYLDSASLNVLVDGKGTLDRYGIALRVIASPDSPAHRLLELTRLAERFEPPTEPRIGSATARVKPR
jgi:anti-sigma B factor antagonist